MEKTLRVKSNIKKLIGTLNFRHIFFKILFYNKRYRDLWCLLNGVQCISSESINCVLSEAAFISVMVTKRRQELNKL